MPGGSRAATRPRSYRSGMAARATFSPSTLDATAYVALSALLGTIAFSVLVPLLVVGVSLLVLALAGLPLIALAFVFCHLLARLERRRALALLGVEFPSRRFEREGALPARTLRWVRSRGSWLELCYAVVALPFVGWVGGTLVFVAWGVAVAFVSFPLWGWAAAGEGRLFGWQLGYLPSSVVHVAVGAGAAARRAVARARCRRRAGGDGPPAARARRARAPQRARRHARADARRHGRGGRRRAPPDRARSPRRRAAAARRAGDDARAGEGVRGSRCSRRSLLDEAHGEAKEALVELRNLARGIHPAVLSDRGLDAAVSALAARCPMPVAVDVDLPRRAGRRHRGDRLLRRRRGADQRRQARAGRARMADGRARRRPARRRSARRRPRRRRSRPARASRACATACAPSTAS